MNIKSIVLTGAIMCANLAFGIEFVLPANPTLTEVTAHKELAEFIPNVTEKLKVGDTEINAIHIGDTPLAIRAALTRASMKDDSYVVRLIGDSIVINGGGTRGVLYGAYHFLEQCGVRFFSPVCTGIPKERALVKGFMSVDYDGSFFFPMRDIYTSKLMPADGGRTAIANGLSRDGDRKISKEFGGAFDYGPPYSCHTFDHYIPAAKYMESHPEFFSLRDGKRYGGQQNGQLCLSNKAMRELCAELLLKNIRETTAKAKSEGIAVPLIYDVSHNDNSRYCQCPECEAFATRENQAGLMVDFLNYLADKVKPEFPDVKLQFFAYQYNAEPPKTLKARDNVIVRICNTGVNQITGCGNDKVAIAKYRRWQEHTSHIYVWDYGITYGDMTGLPYPSEFFYPDVFRFYAENHVSGCFWELEAPDRSDMWELKYFLLSRYMAKPLRDDFDILLISFLSDFYGNAAAKVYEYRKTLLETAKRKNAVIGWFASPVDFSYIDCKDMLKMQDAMDAARKAVAGEPELIFRVNRASMGIDRMLGFEFLSRYRREADHDISARAEAARKRFWDTWEQSAKLFNLDLKSTMERIEERSKNLLALPPITIGKDDHIKNAVSLDFFAPDVATIGNSVSLTPDTDSKYGSSVKINCEKGTTQNFPQSCGIYSLSQNKEIFHWTFPESVWKNNEWQWIELNDILLPPGENCYVYFTNSWVVQILLAYLEPIDRSRPFNIRFHAKLYGDRFFKDGKPSGITIDRVTIWQRKD